MKQKICFFAIVSTLLLGAWLFLAATKKGDVSDTVEILQDGTIIYRFTKEELEEERHIRVAYGEHENIIKTGGGTIKIESADCPDQICVNMGNLRLNAAPIICLPHRLEIRWAKAENKKASDTADPAHTLDAVAR